MTTINMKMISRGWIRRLCLWSQIWHNLVGHVHSANRFCDNPGFLVPSLFCNYFIFRFSRMGIVVLKACLITDQLPLTIQLWLNMKILFQTPWCHQLSASLQANQATVVTRCCIFGNWDTFDLNSHQHEDFITGRMVVFQFKEFRSLFRHSFKWWRWSILHSLRLFFLCSWFCSKNWLRAALSRLLTKGLCLSENNLQKNSIAAGALQRNEKGAQCSDEITSGFYWKQNQVFSASMIVSDRGLWLVSRSQ